MDRAWADAAWQAIESRRVSHVARWRERVRALFREECALVSSRPGDWRKALRSFQGKWLALLTEIWRDAAEEFGSALASKLGARIHSGRRLKALREEDLPQDPELPQWEFEPWSETYAKRVSRLVAKKASQIVETTRRAVARAAELANRSGKAFTEAVTTAYQKFSLSRAQLIADEESRQAAATGEHEAAQGAEGAGLQMTKTWISQRDSRVRSSHVRTDGERVYLDDFFGNGLRYPKDPLGPPEEVMNCRCHLVWGYKPPGREQDDQAA